MKITPRLSEALHEIAHHQPPGRWLELRVLFAATPPNTTTIDRIKLLTPEGELLEGFEPAPAKPRA